MTTKSAQLIKSGVAPLEMNYVTLKDTATNGILGYRSMLKINSLNIGSLYAEQYREVANRTSQGAKLAEWSMKAAFKDVSRLEMFQKQYMFVTTYMPTKMILNGDAVKMLLKLVEKTKFNFCGKICLELMSDILFYDAKQVSDKLNEIKKLGFKTAVSHFGDEFCPVMRLNEMPFDIVFFDDGIGEMLNNDKPEAEAIIKYASVGKQMTVIKCNGKHEILSKAYYAGCSGYISGTPMNSDELVQNGGEA